MESAVSLLRHEVTNQLFLNGFNDVREGHQNKQTNKQYLGWREWRDQVAMKFAINSHFMTTVDKNVIKFIFIFLNKINMNKFQYKYSY